MGMESFLAGLLKPFVLGLFLLLLIFARYAVIRWMPEGRLKSLLLTSDRPLRYGGRTYGGPHASDTPDRNKNLLLNRRR